MKANKLKLVTNNNSLFLREIRKNLDNSDEVFFMTAFGTNSGFKLLEKEFKAFSKRGGKAKFCFDITQAMTEPDLIEELSTFPGDFSVKVGIRDKHNVFLHNKIYFFKTHRQKKVLLVGSNNFTFGGLKKNFDSSIFVEGENEKIFDEVEEYLSVIWSSESSIEIASYSDIFEEYRSLFNNKKKRERKYKNKESDQLEKISNKILTSNKKRVKEGPDIFYILGVLAANIKYQKKSDIEKGILNFKIRKGALNSNNPKDKGYITNVIDGNRLGNIRLNQINTMLKESIRVGQRIEEFFRLYDKKLKYQHEDRTKANFNIILRYEFSEPNVLLRELQNYCLEAKFKNQLIPKRVKKPDEKISIHFVRGYADFRSRISDGDRTGTNGPLRIAMQINKDDDAFLNQFHDFLEKKHKLNVNMLSGAKRGKDNLIRIVADKSATDIFQSGWRRAMANEFALFNETLKPSQ